MEELKVIPLGSVKMESVELDNTLDKQFKPGIFLQTDAFLKGETDRLCSLNQQTEHAVFYNEMAGYGLTNFAKNTD